MRPRRRQSPSPIGDAIPLPELPGQVPDCRREGRWQDRSDEVPQVRRAHRGPVAQDRVGAGGHAGRGRRRGAAVFGGAGAALGPAHLRRARARAHGCGPSTRGPTETGPTATAGGGSPPWRQLARAPGPRPRRAPTCSACSGRTARPGAAARHGRVASLWPDLATSVEHARWARPGTTCGKRPVDARLRRRRSHHDHPAAELRAPRAGWPRPAAACGRARRCPGARSGPTGGATGGRSRARPWTAAAPGA
jgi:hypothetical protein